jgi:hypothetical protein
MLKYLQQRICHLVKPLGSIKGTKHYGNKKTCKIQLHRSINYVARQKLIRL